MPRKPFLVVFLLVLVSILPLETVFAGDSVLVGPARYELRWGRPRAAVIELADPNVISDFKTKIRNGDP